MSTKQIARRIVSEMGRMGMNQKQLAKQAGFSTEIASKICRGEKQAGSATYLMRIAKVFGVTVEYLQHGDSELAGEEERLVSLFRSMTEKQREGMLRVAGKLAGNKKASVHCLEDFT